jgi:hypothetical protein
MKSVANIALIQSLFPIFVSVPRIIYTVISIYVSSNVILNAVDNSWILYILNVLPLYLYSLGPIIEAISIIIALAEIRNKVTKFVKQISSFVLHKVNNNTVTSLPTNATNTIFVRSVRHQ